MIVTLVFSEEFSSKAPIDRQKLEDVGNSLVEYLFDQPIKISLMLELDYLGFFDEESEANKVQAIDLKLIAKSGGLKFSQDIVCAIKTFLKEKLELELRWVFDYAIQSFQELEKNRLKKIFISDMDKTMVDHETLDQLADKVGLGEAVAKITKEGMLGNLDFFESLKKRVRLLKGKALTELVRGVVETITINKGANQVVSTMKKHGAHAVLVSGGFSPIGNEIGALIGFDEVYCNQFGLDNRGNLDGGITGQLIDSKAKKDILTRVAKQHNISISKSLTLGDGANDLPMLLESQSNNGLAVGYKAKPLVRKKIFHQIEHTDLTSLLYFQGIKKTNWTC